MLKPQAPASIRVVIELEGESDPIEGRLVEPEPHAPSFRGWLALTALIETIRNPSLDGDT